MTHIKNRDVSLMVVALVFAGGLSLLGDFVSSSLRSRSTGDSDFGIADIPIPMGGGNGDGDRDGNGGAMAAALLAAIIAVAVMGIAHIFAKLNQFAISRSREYLADAGAVELTKNPDALIAALQRISEDDDVPLASENARAMMISCGFDAGNFFDSLFATHPAIVDRVDKLERYAGGRQRALRPSPGAVGAMRASRGPAIAAAAPAASMGIAGGRAQFGRRG